MIIKRKYKILFSLIMLYICLSCIQNTYAKYTTSANGIADVTISRWNIKINDFDITNNSNFSNAIIPTFNGNLYTNKDIIAPGSEGTFDISIDGTETDTAYSLLLDVEVSEESAVKDLIITKYTIDDDPTEYTYTGTINKEYNLTDNKITTYHFFIKWNDDEDAIMSNEDDTKAATNNGKAIMNINIKITQLNV